MHIAVWIFCNTSNSVTIKSLKDSRKNDPRTEILSNESRYYGYTAYITYLTKECIWSTGVTTLMQLRLSDLSLIVSLWFCQLSIPNSKICTFHSRLNLARFYSPSLTMQFSINQPLHACHQWITNIPFRN